MGFVSGLYIRMQRAQVDSASVTLEPALGMVLQRIEPMEKKLVPQ